MLEELFALVREKPDKLFQLPCPRSSGDAEPEAVSDAVSSIGSGLGQDASGEPSSCVQKHRVVEQVQRLQRRIGPSTTHASGLAAGSVENRKRGVREDALPESVEPPPIAIFPQTRAPVVRDVELLEQTVGLGGNDAGAVHLGTQEAV